MTKLEKLLKRYYKARDKIDKYSEDCNRNVLREVYSAKLTTAEEIYRLMIGEFASKIDRSVADEIAKRFNVEVQS